MKSTNPSLRFVLALLVVAIAPACKSKGPKGVGFLDDYSKLEPMNRADRKDSWNWFKPGIDLRKYDYLLIDPIVVMGHMRSATEKLSPELKKKASDGFSDVLFETIDPYYNIVQRPADHVLRLRIALTDLTPDEGEGEGSASLEAELLDARTGEKLAAFISTIDGSKGGWRAQKKWLAVEGAFIEWSKGLLEFMDSFHEDAEIEGA